MGEQIKSLKNKAIILVAAWLLVMPAGNALSENGAELPVTRGVIIKDYARITFQWPKPVLFTATSKGKILTVTFDEQTTPDFSKLLEQLKPYVTRAQANGRTIVLTLDKPYRTRTFISDNIGGIDLLHIDQKEPQVAKTEGKPKTKAESKKIATVGEAKKLAALAPAAGEEKSAEKPEEAPTTKAEEKPAEKPPEKAPEPTPPPVADTSKQLVEKPVETALKSEEKPPEKAVEKPALIPPPAVLENPLPSSDIATPPDELAKKMAAAAAAHPDHIKVGISAETDNAVLRFPLTERVAVASFQRAGTLWVVFNKPLTLDLSDFNELPPTVLGKGEILSAHNATILRVPLDDNIYASVAKQEGSFEWAVLLTAKSSRPLNALKIETNTEPPAPANVFLSILEMSDPIKVRDPQIGDELVITPLFNLGEGIFPRRDFVEFTLLDTAQGVALAKKSDDVTVSQLRNGLRISSPHGITLTPGLPDAEPAHHNALQNSTTFFPYDAWKLAKDAGYREVTRGLFHRIVEAKNSEESNEARTRLAQIYLTEGLAPEAVALLDGVNRTNPIFYRSNKLAALRGAANFLMYRFSEAARDFAASELNNNKEADYWRNMLADLLGNPTPYDFLEMNPDYISKYPPIFRQRLAIVAADRSVDSKEYNVALKIFDTLHQDNLLEPINGYVNYLLAKISADTGQEKEASESWDRLAEDWTHPFVASRAEFSRIVWGMDHDTLTKDQAIDRLERLRLAWHGDGLELKILTLLGDLYSERKDYVNAMRIWNGGVVSFPNTAPAIEMGHKMETAFIIMFNDGASDTLSTIDALTLYYQYRNYTPSGTTGTAMVSHLADRLVAMDLLDQAALLLDHQMHFQVEKSQRSEIGVKLATVQLLNHQPKKAVEALEDSMYGENPALLRTLRNRLTAEALSELEQFDKALQILGQDTSTDADNIRLNIYWKQKDWPHLINMAETILKSRRDLAAPLSLDESDVVLKLALAYVFANNTVQLQYLHDYFGPLMEKNPNKALFYFITSGDVTPNPTNFDDVMKYMSRTRSFIDTYRARIQTSGLNYMLKDKKDDAAKEPDKKEATKEKAPKEAAPKTPVPKENAPKEAAPAEK